MNCATCEILKNNYQHRNHRDGTFYMQPVKFPAVLHDRMGCVLITAEHFNLLQSMGTIKISHAKNGDKMNIKGGIANLQGYSRCSNVTLCPGHRQR